MDGPLTSLITQRFMKHVKDASFARFEALAKEFEVDANAFTLRAIRMRILAPSEVTSAVLNQVHQILSENGGPPYLESKIQLDKAKVAFLASYTDSVAHVLQLVTGRTVTVSIPPRGPQVPYVAFGGYLKKDRPAYALSKEFAEQLLEMRRDEWVRQQEECDRYPQPLPEEDAVQEIVRRAAPDAGGDEDTEEAPEEADREGKRRREQ